MDKSLITSEQYLNLVDPEFIGQTRLDENNQYKMYWKCKDVMYYTINTL